MSKRTPALTTSAWLAWRKLRAAENDIIKMLINPLTFAAQVSDPFRVFHPCVKCVFITSLELPPLRSVSLFADFEEPVVRRA